MTLFQLVKIVLDHLYAEGAELYGSKLDGKITQNLEYLSESYNKLTDPARKPVDYEDPATRFAYVYKYVAAHGDYVVQVLKELAAKRGGVFDGANARVSCLGGGPGSDIIAVLKYLDEEEDTEDVKKLILLSARSRAGLGRHLDRTHRVSDPESRLERELPAIRYH